MDQKRGPPQSNGLTLAEQMNIVTGIVLCLGYAANITLRVGHGHRWVGGVPALCGVIVFPALAMAACPPPRGQADWSGTLWLVLFGFQMARRMGIGRHRHEHSWFVGRPVLGEAMELPLGFGVAALLIVFSPAAAGYMAVSTVCHAATMSMLEWRDERRVESINDQAIEAKYYSERYRNTYGE